MLPANRAFDSNGLALAGAKAKLYETGTNTPATFYSDEALTVPLGSTITANGAGRFTPLPYQDEATPFRLIVTDANDVELDDIDPYYFGSTIYGTFTLPSGSSVPSLAALKVIANPADGQTAILSADGGNFTFTNDGVGNAALVSQLASLASAPNQTFIVPPSTDTTGASGAWVRKYSGSADIRWFGADTAATAVANKAAIQVALNVAKEVMVPKLAAAFSSTGGIVIPSGGFIRGPGTIDFDGSAATYFASLGSAQDAAGVSSSNMGVVGVNFTCSTDIQFIHIIKLENGGATLDRVFINFNTVTYTATPTTGDRWFINGRYTSATGAATWSNVQVIGNVLDGPMQLIAGCANGTAKHWAVRHNIVNNARSNGIFFSSGAASAGNPATVEDIDISHNQISADSYTSVGILVGLDNETVDRNFNIRRVKICNNKIYLNHAAATWGIGIRGGNDCSGIGGFASDLNGVEIHGNEIYTQAGQAAIHVGCVGVSTAAAVYIKNFVLGSNLILQGDVLVGGVDEGCFKSNVVRGNFQPINTSLVMRSSGNTYQTLSPATAATFEMRSDGDTFIGRDPASVGPDRPVDIAPTTGATQTVYLNNAVINSRQASGSNRNAAVRTSGLGTATVFIHNMTSATTWADGRTVQTTGTITEFTDAAALANANTWAAAQTFASSAKSTSATAGVGYATGAGGAATQATNKTTSVTQNKICGTITMNNAALAASNLAEFTVTNSAVSATDAIILNLASGNVSNSIAYRYWISGIAAGSFKIAVENRSGSSLSEALVFNYAILKSVAA
jgi:hypothetical protein